MIRRFRLWLSAKILDKRDREIISEQLQFASLVVRRCGPVFVSVVLDETKKIWIQQHDEYEGILEGPIQ